MTTAADRRAFQVAERELLAAFAPDVAAAIAGEPTCRECGCSESIACPEGCWWVEADFCSTCAAAAEAQELERATGA